MSGDFYRLSVTPTAAYVLIAQSVRGESNNTAVTLAKYRTTGNDQQRKAGFYQAHAVQWTAGNDPVCGGDQLAPNNTRAARQ